MWWQLLQSKLWCEAPQSVRVVWITLVLLADPSGRIAESVEQIAEHAVVPVEECRAALDALGPEGFDRIRLDGETVSLRERSYGPWRRQG